MATCTWTAECTKTTPPLPSHTPPYTPWAVSSELSLSRSAVSRRDATHCRAGRGVRAAQANSGLSAWSASRLRLVLAGHCLSGNPATCFPLPCCFPKDNDSRHSRNITVDAVEEHVLNKSKPRGSPLKFIPRFLVVFCFRERERRSSTSRNLPAPQTCGVGLPRSGSPSPRMLHHLVAPGRTASGQCASTACLAALGGRALGRDAVKCTYARTDQDEQSYLPANEQIIRRANHSRLVRHVNGCSICRIATREALEMWVNFPWYARKYKFWPHLASSGWIFIR